MQVQTHNLRKPLIRLIVLVLLGAFNLNAQNQSIETILKGFVESYKTDNMAHTITFGIRVGDQWWHVKSLRKQEGYAVGKNKQYTFHNFSPHEVTLHQGKPTQPTWYFHYANKEVLDKIDQKIWTTSTASAKSFGTDIVGLNIRDMAGFQSNIKDDAIAYEVMEHFWKKGQVEVTYFKRDSALPTHGVDHVGLYTMKDKRIGWFSIGPEEAANTERGLDKGQVPNLFIVTKGKGRAELGDGVVELEPGMSVFVPPYVRHVIYNPYDEPMEGIVVLFGDNIDFARGKSYMDFLEQQHEFYETYDKSISASSN